jgi:NDP-sugar pyrophosphorylase family protein
LLGDEGSVLVVNGDCVLSLDLRGFAEHHLASDHLVTLALLPHLDPEKWSRVELDANGFVSDFNPPGQPEPLEVPFLYPGVMAVHRDALDALPAATPGDIPTVLWDPVRAQGRLGGLVVAGHWREVGTPTDYLDVMLLRLAGASVIDPSASIGSAAKIENAFIGREVVVADEATVEDSVIAESAVIGKHVTVRGSVLLGGVIADPGEAIIDTVRVAKMSD